MKLLSLSVQNLFSIGDIDLDIEDKGLTLVSGHSFDEQDPNGSGKSSLAHKAITWTLWGNTSIGAKADKVIKKGSKGTSRGLVRFEAFGRNYIVERTRKPNALKFYSDTEDYTQATEKETQKLINDALGRDLSTWLQTDFFGQGRKMSYPELTANGQKEILEDILPLDKLSEWAANTNKSLKELKTRSQELNTNLQILSATLRDSISEHSNLVEAEKTQALRLKELHAKERKEVQDKVDLYKSQLEERPPAERITELEESIQEALIARQQTEEYLKHLKSQLDECVYCKQAMPGSPLTNEERATLKDEIENYTNIKQQWDERYNELRSNLDSLDVTKFILIEHQFKSAEDKLASIDAQTEQAIQPFTEEIERLKVKIQTLTQSKQNDEENLAAVQAEIEAVAFWEKVFTKDLRNFLLSSVCPFLDSRANYYIDKLGNSQIEIKFSTVKAKANGDMKEEFNVAVESLTGGAEFALLSGGEQQLASFAIGLALADLAETQVSSSSRFMVLDEPFTNLGTTNCERLTEFLFKELEGKKDTIFLISNENSLKDLVPNQIHVTKRHGTTTLQN